MSSSVGVGQPGKRKVRRGAWRGIPAILETVEFQGGGEAEVSYLIACHLTDFFVPTYRLVDNKSWR